MSASPHEPVNPPFTDLAQSPYKPDVLLMAVKQLPSLVNLMPALRALAGDVFMAVQDHLGRERRMPADLDGDMPPITVENMKRVVVHVWLLPLKVIIRFYVPHRCLGATDQDQKQT